MSEKIPDRLCIAMVSDFFYPNVGGVESHIYQLSQCLIQLGHKVIILTHAYGDKNQRCGVRYITNGLKVFYLPLRPYYNQCIFPAVLTSTFVTRDIFIREEVDIVHGHSSFSTLAHECIFTGRSLGLRAVFTDHSLFGFADVSSILTNEVLQFSLSDTNHVICVSHTSKENTALRAFYNPENVFVIPNAVDASIFRPDPTMRDRKYVNIVVMSRLVYRKGIDLLIEILPQICQQYPFVRFIIGGDGPKRLLLEEIREEHRLHERVQLLGSVPHEDVRNVLVQGDIFINTSLTEAFCIAIVEAACCGLQVVSTDVGGVPEVLPPHLIHLTKPNSANLMQVLKTVIENVHAGSLPLTQQEIHNHVKSIYTWPHVAQRTELVYQSALSQPKRNFKSRIKEFRKAGPIFGYVVILLCIINWLIIQLLEKIKPAQTLEKMPSLCENDKIRDYYRREFETSNKL